MDPEKGKTYEWCPNDFETHQTSCSTAVGDGGEADHSPQLNAAFQYFISEKTFGR